MIPSFCLIALSLSKGHAEGGVKKQGLSVNPDPLLSLFLETPVDLTGEVLSDNMEKRESMYQTLFQGRKDQQCQLRRCGDLLPKGKG